MVTLLSSELNGVRNTTKCKHHSLQCFPHPARIQYWTTMRGGPSTSTPHQRHCYPDDYSDGKETGTSGSGAEHYATSNGSGLVRLVVWTRFAVLDMLLSCCVDSIWVLGEIVGCIGL
ncbi:uncharacterized protein LOC120124377 [Hibiscus syriacus]|uniref:uncharacterized protein LOC120124377 n=1 Tax=Hibiscus syriacus TaxID=106335 RepID=UPI00192372D9|nr:uncharacterized protein LOC120124377 [Hibiscus syriacus]